MRVAVIAVVALLGGCDEKKREEAPPRRESPPTAPTPEAGAEAPTVKRARCPHDAENCAAVTGRVIYVEPIDADGDGDAHYVLAGGNVTARGLSVIDVGRSLRPRRLPRLGELVSAAGPVYPGRFGQRQIQAIEVNHQR